MHIHTLYTYPIKSLRGVSLPSSSLTHHGLLHDRRFCLVQDLGEGEGEGKGAGAGKDPAQRYKPMYISQWPQMGLFGTELRGLDGRGEGPEGGSVVVTYNPPQPATSASSRTTTPILPANTTASSASPSTSSPSTSTSSTASSSTSTSITIPLRPDLATPALALTPIDIDMHHSPCRALEMPQLYTDWFTSCFNLGTPVILVYLGPRYRQVLGNLAPNAGVRNPVLREEAERERERERQERERKGESERSVDWASWLGSKVANLASAPSVTTPSAPPAPPAPPPRNATTTLSKFTRPISSLDYSITFQDGASYLITSTTSLAALHTRMPDGELADMTKFRPNIVLEGAGEAWEEDFWGELTFNPNSENNSVGRERAKLLLNHNCVRCTSLNVDYATGSNTSGTNVLKLLQRDRRVDTEQKWSPVFGRYGWLVRGGEEEEEHMFEIKVGDEVVVTRRNTERSGQKWPGWGGTREDDLWPI